MKLSTIVAGSAASVLLLNGFAFAQQQGQGQQLSNREVRQFVSGIERDVNQIVQSGDLSRLRPWTQSHVADHAVLNRTNMMETEGHSRVMSSVTLTKPDLLRLQRFVLSNMSEKLNNIEDYRLDIQVQNVEPVGDSAAIVKSRVTERATVTSHREGGRYGEQREGQRGEFTTGQGSKSEMQSEEEEEGMPRQRGRQQTSHGQGVQLELQANCTHMIERSKDSGRLLIGMGVCDATTEAQF